MTLRPCINCGEPTPDTRCDDCAPVHARAAQKVPTTSASARGYGWRWTQLSRRARAAQPWCTDCGTEDNLTADHSTEAWRRHDAGLPIRLRDVDVVCGTCNVRRGSSRPGGKRSPERSPTPPGQAQKGLRMVLKSEEGR